MISYEQFRQPQKERGKKCAFLKSTLAKDYWSSSCSVCFKMFLCSYVMWFLSSSCHSYVAVENSFFVRFFCRFIWKTTQITQTIAACWGQMHDLNNNAPFFFAHIAVGSIDPTFLFVSFSSIFIRFDVFIRFCWLDDWPVCMTLIFFVHDIIYISPLFGTKVYYWFDLILAFAFHTSIDKYLGFRFVSLRWVESLMNIIL